MIVNSGSLEEDEELDIEKKEKGTDYAKLAKAIGDITSRGIDVSLVNINESDYGFEPDVENNRILYGLKALSNINAETIEKIKCGRPYIGIKDFMVRCPLTKTAMFNLIKAGAFDEIETDLHSRKEIMVYYISKVCEPKKRLTLQNFNGLVQHNLIPKELELQIRVFNFTKYLKMSKKVGKYYVFDDICMKFFEKHIPEILDEVETVNNAFCMLQTKWDNIYQAKMDPVRDWLKDNQESILTELNDMLFMEMWNKYAAGTQSHWEMDSLCFYHGPHELINVDPKKYDLADFNELKSNEVEYYMRRRNAQIPIYKLHRIAGTVIAKDDNHHTVSLLTTTGVVTVKFSREYYSLYKKQVSQIQPDGTKKVLEKSWFKRGTMLMVTGFRRDDQFVGKTYQSTATHQLYKITDIVDDEIKLQHERVTSSGALEEDYDE